VTNEARLREKLQKIEALLDRAGTPGERQAAGAAAERIRARLHEDVLRDTPVEMRFSIQDPWSRRLFIALARRYGLRPYRYPRMRRQTVVLKAPQSFLDGVLWPTFIEINSALVDYLAEVTDEIIREQIYGETGEADEVATTTIR
jgi:hypothetical protein